MIRIKGFSNISWVIDSVGRHISEMRIIKTEEPNFEKKGKQY